MDFFSFNTGEEIIQLPLLPDARKMYIEITTECNYSCITCIRHSWQDQEGRMSERTFEHILQGLADFPDMVTVHIGGFGEPFTHPRLFAWIAALKKAGYNVEMITNGSFLDAQAAARLIDLQLDWLFVSLDGPDSASFELIRPGASFEEVKENLARLQSLKRTRGKIQPRIGVEFVGTRSNFDRLPAMRRIVDELRADKFVFTNVLPYHESMKEEILYDQGADITRFGWESPLLSVKISPNFSLRTERRCRFVDSKAMVVNSAGVVSPCYALMHDYRCYILGREKAMKAYSFGNVNDRSLKDIWTDSHYASFRWMARNARYPSCTDCRQVDGCVLAQTNEADCWGNQPSCGDCLWARDLIVCP